MIFISKGMFFLLHLRYKPYNAGFCLPISPFYPLCNIVFFVQNPYTCKRIYVVIRPREETTRNKIEKNKKNNTN